MNPSLHHALMCQASGNVLQEFPEHAEQIHFHHEGHLETLHKIPAYGHGSPSVGDTASAGVELYRENHGMP